MPHIRLLTGRMDELATMGEKALREEISYLITKLRESEEETYRVSWRRNALQGYLDRALAILNTYAVGVKKRGRGYTNMYRESVALIREVEHGS